MTPFRGLTWDHPRGYAALDRAAAEAGGIIAWDRQPLEGFESAPIEAVCAGYDLVVLDHPHLGDALAAQCLKPLDALLPVETLADIGERTLGPCFQSYEMGGHVWALPLDAAAQVSAGRPDLMSDEMPKAFDALERTAASEPGFVLSLAGPHAFLTLLSLSASADSRFGSPEDSYFQPHHDDAIDFFFALMRWSHTIGLTHNPIALLEAMAEGIVSYCPLVFGYVTYAARDSTHPLTFRDAPRARPELVPHAVLGGTGIAVTQSCTPTPELVAHLSALLSEQMQAGLIVETGGQPSCERAWLSEPVNAAFNGFYRQTLSTLRHAFVRPRHPGFVPTQSEASAWLREALPAPPAAATVRDRLNAILRGA